MTKTFSEQLHEAFDNSHFDVMDLSQYLGVLSDDIYVWLDDIVTPPQDVQNCCFEFLAQSEKYRESGEGLGDRMKGYEAPWDFVLPARMPVIIRLDGHSWHSYTKGLNRPFDQNLIEAMNEVMLDVCQYTQGCVLGYTQSDEITLLVHNYKTLKTQPLFGNRVGKICSLLAARAAATMSMRCSERVFGKPKQTEFDCRVFVAPEAEVNNVLLWRQQDATRNSISMLAQSLYSHKELHKKNSSELQEMCWKKGHNWNDLPTHLKRGRCAYKIQEEVNGVMRSRWFLDLEPPIFSQDPSYVERHLAVESK